VAAHPTNEVPKMREEKRRLIRMGESLPSSPWEENGKASQLDATVIAV